MAPLPRGLVSYGARGLYGGAWTQEVAGFDLLSFRPRLESGAVANRSGARKTVQSAIKNKRTGQLFAHVVLDGAGDLSVHGLGIGSRC